MKKEIDNEFEKNNEAKSENTPINDDEKSNQNEDKTVCPENEKETQNTAADAKDVKEVKNKELDELNDKYIRLYAEYDNYRKRSEKEKGESYQAGMIFTVTQFIPLLDNLDRALAYEPENEGLKLICKQLREIFEKLGVEEINADGQNFDPNLHNAVMHEEDAEKGENLVVQTFQKGYSVNGKIVRHAVVKVVN